MSASDDQGDDDTAVSLPARPEVEPIARAVAQAKVARHLFARQEHVTLGRYHLVEPIGAGGMGIVWGAFDPQLGRGVAIKLLKAGGETARILAEAQALAKLAHPNVVTVFDVGQVDDQVYVVMEWIRGETLRAYGTAAHTPREILDVYVAAGHGLAAAHRAGFVHRDFKPDNAIVGDDGRVRVLDFGLARGEAPTPDANDVVDEGSTRGAGTPRYMAPEQREGRAVTAAADQFAFCVSLREGLVGGAPGGGAVPRWIDAILMTGMAIDPAQRFPSMEALLRSLARDPAVARRRRWIAAGITTISAGAFALGVVGFARDESTPRCTGGAVEIAAVWSPATRTKLAAHLGELGAFARQDSARIDGELERYGATWAATHAAACRAQDRGELAAPMYQRAAICMARAKATFATVIEVLATSTPTDLADALVVAGSLPDVTRCLTEGTQSLVALPPAAGGARASTITAEIERVRVLALARRPTAKPAARAVLEEARALGYPPLVARGELVLGLAYFFDDVEQS